MNSKIKEMTQTQRIRRWRELERIPLHKLTIANLQEMDELEAEMEEFDQANNPYEY